jgi:hypothetical protein
LHPLRHYFRFTIREILFAMVALGALLGWWRQRPVGRAETELCGTLNLDHELQRVANQEKIKISFRGSGSGHSLGHFEARSNVEIPTGDIEQVMRAMRARLREELLDVKDIRMRGESRSNDDFSYKYEVRDIHGRLSFYLLPARQPDMWHALLIVHETRTRR